MQKEHLPLLIQFHSLTADDVQLLTGNAQFRRFRGRCLRFLRRLQGRVRFSAHIRQEVPDKNEADSHQEQGDQNRQHDHDQRIWPGLLPVLVLVLFLLIVIRLRIGNLPLIGFGIHLVKVKNLLALSGIFLSVCTLCLLQKVLPQPAARAIPGTAADRTAVRSIRIRSPANVTNYLTHSDASSCPTTLCQYCVTLYHVFLGITTTKVLLFSAFSIMIWG